MYLCRILTNESFPKIGESFGNRDHTTVMHGYKKIEQDKIVEVLKIEGVKLRVKEID